jgi:transitional endoplasmic reticulum ATPase
MAASPRFGVERRAVDDATLASLRLALDASPDNAVLRMLLVRALVERSDDDGAAALAEPCAVEAMAAADDRRVLAGLWLRMGQLDRAQAWCTDREPTTALLLARILLARGEVEPAARAYREAVADNPTLEDAELHDALGLAARRPTGDGPRMLRVVANDDTDATEVARLLHPEARRVTFADVAGLDEVKTQIQRRIVLPFKKPSLFARFKKRVGGGILLYGPPGCGKTLLARATAGECEATFLSVDISDVLDMYIGESERKLHALFERARQKTPSVLFFDELEALASKRQFSREGTSSKLVSQFLAEMDGFSRNNQGVLVLGATNTPWGLDPAFRRPGRFDRVQFVPPPDRAARVAILRLVLADRPTAGELPIDTIAGRTSGFSGADLENLVETAADLAIEASLAHEREVPIGGEHLRVALDTVKPTTHEWLTTARNYARYANEGGQYDDVLRFLEQNARR